MAFKAIAASLRTLDSSCKLGVLRGGTMSERPQAVLSNRQRLGLDLRRWAFVSHDTGEPEWMPMSLAGLTLRQQLLSTTSGEEYDVILDLFGTSAKNGPQPKALTELLAILTKSTAGTLGTLALFLPNFATEGVIRRLLLASDGQCKSGMAQPNEPFCLQLFSCTPVLQRGVKIVAASSPSELLKLVSYNSLQLSAETTGESLDKSRLQLTDSSHQLLLRVLIARVSTIFSIALRDNHIPSRA